MTTDDAPCYFAARRQTHHLPIPSGVKSNRLMHVAEFRHDSR